MPTRKQPLISLVIPVLNEAHALSRQFETGYLPDDEVEVIVVDGGSEDDSVEIARQYASQVFTTTAGRARQMNLGAQSARADTLVFLHADTLLTNNDIQQVLSIVSSTHQPFWGHFMIRLSGRHWLLRWVERLMNLRSRLTRIATGDQTLFVSRTLFQHVGGFPDIALMEDIAITSRLKKISRPKVIDAQLITSSRRWEQKGVVRTVITMWLLRFAYWCGVNEQRLANIYYGRK